MAREFEIVIRTHVDATIRALLAAVDVGIAKALPRAGREYALELKAAAPVASGRLLRSLRVVPRYLGNGRFNLRVQAIFYAPASNAQSGWADKALEIARPKISAILRSEVSAELRRRFPPR